MASLRSQAATACIEGRSPHLTSRTRKVVAISNRRRRSAWQPVRLEAAAHCHRQYGKHEGSSLRETLKEHLEVAEPADYDGNSGGDKARTHMQRNSMDVMMKVTRQPLVV